MRLLELDPKQVASELLAEMGYIHLCNIASAAQRLLEEMEHEGYKTDGMEELRDRLVDLRKFVEEAERERI